MALKYLSRAYRAISIASSVDLISVNRLHAACNPATLIRIVQTLMLGVFLSWEDIGHNLNLRLRVRICCQNQCFLFTNCLGTSTSIAVFVSIFTTLANTDLQLGTNCPHSS